MSSASNATLLFELLTTNVAHIRKHGPELMLYLHIVLSALFPIYTGAHASLSRPSSAAKADKEHGSAEDDGEEEQEEVRIMEGLSASDAVVFPITAGLVLATLYWLIKRYGADIINVILAWYFAGTSIFSVAKLFSDGSALWFSCVFPRHYEDQGHLFEVLGKEQKTIAQQSKDKQLDRWSPLPGSFGRLSLSTRLQTMLWRFRSTLKDKYTFEAHIKILLDVKGDFAILDSLGLLVGISAVAYNGLISKPWWLTNVQGFAVSYFALQLISPTSFRVGSLVLGGLFFYDIWAVFFTPLMVTVATKLDQPIKLLFPRPDSDTSQMAYSMLGLGDIVLPGLMVGLALRFDLYVFYMRKQTKVVIDDKTEEVKKAPYTAAKGQWGSLFWTSRLAKRSLPEILQNAAFPKPYFTAAIIGYVVGMIATLAVMTLFQHAQPALLYLVPAVLSSLWGTAAFRGELAEMWTYSEEVTGEDLTDAKKEGLEHEKQQREDSDQTWLGFIKNTLSGEEKKSTPNATKTDEQTVKSEEHLTAAAKDPDTMFSVTVKRRLGKVRRHDEDGGSKLDQAKTETAAG